MNAGPDQLSRIENGDEPTNLEEGLPDAQLFVVHIADDHFANIIQFLSTGTAPEMYTTQQKKELVAHTVDLSVIAGHLFKMGSDEILHRYVPKYERQSILAKAHGGVAGGYYAGRAIVKKIV